MTENVFFINLFMQYVIPFNYIFFKIENSGKWKVFHFDNNN